MEDWEAVGGSPDSAEKALKAVSSRLRRWPWGGFPACPEADMDSASVMPHQCGVQRHLEALEQRLSALEQEARGPGEPSSSDSEALSDRGDECSEAAGPCLAVGPIMQQKVKQEPPVAWGGGCGVVGTLVGPPM